MLLKWSLAFSLNADRAPQLKASVIGLLSLLLATRDYQPAIQVIWRHLNHNAVSGKNPDKVFHPPPRDARQHLASIVLFNPENSTEQRLEDRAVDLYRPFISHSLLWRFEAISDHAASVSAPLSSAWSWLVASISLSGTDIGRLVNA